MTAVVHVACHVLSGDGRGGHGRGEENKGLGEEHGCREGAEGVNVNEEGE